MNAVVAVTDDEEAGIRERLLAQLDERGNAVVCVPEDGPMGGYAFTAGVHRKHGIPEAIVIGLPEQMSPVLLDAYVDLAANGVEFKPGQTYPGIFQGINVAIEKVDPLYYPTFFGLAFALYPDGDFPAIQIIVPTADGHWPWDSSAPDGFAAWQPILTHSGEPESFPRVSDG